MNFAKKSIIHLLLLVILVSTTMPLYQANDTMATMDISQLPNKQEITIPIDTSLEESKYQPIDIRVTFESPCWVENETVHSIRVAYGEGSDLTEIESQIYDLQFTDDTHIDACSLVFLIPSEATGTEKYYLLYDDQQTDPPAYQNHLEIKDTHYFYEPISGQIMDFDYYQIIEDDDIIFAVVQRGELLGNGMSNTIIKLLPESKEFKTKNAEQIASFYMSYSTDPSGTHTGSQWSTDIEKSIVVHGNLMIRLQIQGISPNGNIKTNNIYSYYYSPTITKKMNVNIDHDVLNTVEAQGNQEREGTYCSLSTIKARSGTIEDMNLGEILPNIHIYNEDETIRNYDIPTDPSAHPADWLLSSTDDEDLGSKAWFCMDNPSTGMVHGLIFDKYKGFLNGTNDGIQVKTSVHQHVKLPGLEADSGDLYAMRNAYENGEHSTTLSDEINVKFNVVYVGAQTGGYEYIDRESSIYQTLITQRPIKRGNTTEQPTTEIDRYTLTVLLHNAPSAPLGSLLAAATGRNISYLTAELYKENDLASSGSAQRLQLGDVNIDLEGKSFTEKIQTIRGIFDIKNSTIFKSVRFPDLEPGTYLVKIYKENPRFGNQRKYIGYTLVEITSDTRVHVTCKKETAMDVIVTDQDDNAIDLIDVTINLDDVIISDAVTDEQGTAHLTLPLERRAMLSLQGFYQGFKIIEQDITFGVLDRWRTQQVPLSIDLYDLNIQVVDTFGLPPAINPNPIVTSDEMVKMQTIQAVQMNPGEYEFTDLFSSSYNLKMSYKSFKIDERIDLSQDTTKELIFPAEFPVTFDVYNAHGLPIQDAKGSLTREHIGPTLTVTNGDTSTQVPPGTYELTIQSDDNLIAAQPVSVKGEKTLTIISNQGSILHTALTILLLVGGIIGSMFLFTRQKKRYAFHVLLIMIMLLSLFQPWWLLHGENDDITTETKTLLIPANIITISTSPQIIGGEISEVPEEFTLILHLIMYLILIATTMTALHIFVSNRYKKVSFILRVLIIIMLLLSVVLFYVAMSEVTKIGIGGFSGADSISITLPGTAETIDVPSSWGPSSGMILAILSLLGGIFLLLQKKLIPLIHRFVPSLK